MLPLSKGSVNPHLMYCYYSTFRLHSNKDMHTDCKNRSLARSCLGIALRMQGSTSRESGRLNCYFIVLNYERNTCLAGYRYAIIATSVQTHRITFKHREEYVMEHIKTLNTKSLQNTVKKGGCGECQTSCQSACKTSCTVGNQSCENK